MSNRIACIFTVVGTFAFSANVHGQAAHTTHSERVQNDPSNPSKSDGPEVAKAVESIIELTNDFRKSEGSAKVTAHPKLTETARYFAEFMAKTGKYGHTADDQSPAERAKKHGYEYCIVLENIAYQFRSRGFTTEELAKGFFEGWKNSPGHRKNMLDADVSETGVAIARSEETGYFYAVQMFGRPKTAAIEFSLNNKTQADIEYSIGEEKFSLPPRYTRTHERCRPETMTLQSPDKKKESVKSLKPKNGEHFVVTEANGGYQIKKE